MDVECVDCVEASSRSTRTSLIMRNHQCFDTYIRVADCMDNNRNQVTSCREEWTLFRDCMNQNDKNKNKNERSGYNRNKKGVKGAVGDNKGNNGNNLPPNNTTTQNKGKSKWWNRLLGGGGGVEGGEKGGEKE